MANEDFTSNKATQKVRKLTPTPKARSRSKSRINPKVIANIVFINPETRKQQAHTDWLAAFRRYVDTLSNDEQSLVKKCLAFTIAKPINREYLQDRCPVIPFPAMKK